MRMKFVRTTQKGSKAISINTNKIRHISEAKERHPELTGFLECTVFVLKNGKAITIDGPLRIHIVDYIVKELRGTPVLIQVYDKYVNETVITTKEEPLLQPIGCHSFITEDISLLGTVEHYLKGDV